MSKYYKRLLNVLLLSIYFIAGTPAQKAMAQYGDEPITYQTFYDNLAPYGQWVEDPQYGYVFVPDVQQGFRPYYTNGHWVMTEYGNTWVSDYQWGWACFHYGRWTYDNYYGWVWVPGTEWGPSWVSWRYGDGYYGWAPLGPDYQMGMDFGGYYTPEDWWVFLPPEYLYRHKYYRYWNGAGQNMNIIRNTTVINNTYFNNNTTYITGPRSSDIENQTHQPVQVYHLNTLPNPRTSQVKGNTLNIYRPLAVAQNAGGNGRPVNVIRAEQPISARPQPISTNQGQPVFHNPRSNPSFDAEPARMPVQQNNNAHSYEWDANRTQPQTARPVQNEPQQNNYRPQTQPVQNIARPQPQQNIARPQPQNISRPQVQPQAPRQVAPQNNGGRR